MAVGIKYLRLPKLLKEKNNIGIELQSQKFNIYDKGNHELSSMSLNNKNVNAQINCLLYFRVKHGYAIIITKHGKNPPLNKYSKQISQHNPDRHRELQKQYSGRKIVNLRTGTSKHMQMKP